MKKKIEPGRRVSIYWTKNEYKQLDKLKPHPMIKMSTFLKKIIKDTLKIT